MSAGTYKLVWDAVRRVWHVSDNVGVRSGAIASFPTLLEAENYVTGRESEADTA